MSRPSAIADELIPFTVGGFARPCKIFSAVLLSGLIIIAHSRDETPELSGALKRWVPVMFGRRRRRRRWRFYERCEVYPTAEDARPVDA